MADEKMNEQETQRQPLESDAVRPLNAPAAAPKVKKPELEDTWVIDVAGNMSVVRTVKGERPKPGTPLGSPGSRVATRAEIEAHQAKQGPG